MPDDVPLVGRVPGADVEQHQVSDLGQPADGRVFERGVRSTPGRAGRGRCWCPRPQVWLSRRGLHAATGQPRLHHRGAGALPRLRTRANRVRATSTAIRPPRECPVRWTGPTTRRSSSRARRSRWAWCGRSLSLDRPNPARRRGRRGTRRRTPRPAASRCGGPCSRRGSGRAAGRPGRRGSRSTGSRRRAAGRGQRWGHGHAPTCECVSGP
jgi:hypothetical protein